MAGTPVRRGPAAGEFSGRYAWSEHDVLDPAGDRQMMPRHEVPAARQFSEESAAVAAPKAEATAAQ